MDSKITRRSFIKGGAFLGAGAATVALFGSLSGCSKQERAGGANNTAITKDGFGYAVHSADVIVVGGGTAGLMAARTACDRGASVILVDKGPVGHSGNSGLLWGQTYVTAELTNDDAKAATELFALDVMGIIDQEQARNVVLAQMESRPRAAIEQGGNVFQRGDDGNVIGIKVTDNIAVTHGALYRQPAQHLVNRGVPIFDNTMMLDILLDDLGAVSGIVGMNLKDSSAHVFRGKKVILCTGGYHWAARSSGSPESTGEGHLALLKRGYRFKDMEFPQYDFGTIRPYGYRPDKEKDAIEIGVSLAVNGEVEHRICNKNNQPIKKEVFAADGHQAAFQSAMIISAKEIFAGNGTVGDGSNNGLMFSLADIDNESNNQSYHTYKGFLKYTSENMDYEFPEYVETIANQYSSCGTPEMDPATCESKIPGLYPIFVALANFSSMWQSGQAYLAAKDASNKAAQIDTLPSYKTQDVDELISKAYGLLNAAPTDGIRSSEVYRRIQRAFYKGQDFIKSGEKIQAMINELERIKRDDVPRMYCEDKSILFNRDWRKALEVESLLICSFGTAYAALARKESRSPFFREDYPKMDNDGFFCFMWTSMDNKGNWTVEKGDIVDTVISREACIEALGDIDISVPNQY